MVFVFLYKFILPPKTHFEIFWRPFWIFFADSWSTHEAVETNWSSFFDIKFFYPLKLILNFFGGHFKLFWWPFGIFFTDSWSAHKPVETKWYLFFDINVFYPLKLILKVLAAIFNFSAAISNFFLQIPGLLIKLWKQIGLSFVT